MNVIIHTLAEGEKLSDVARRFGTSTADIIALNTHKPSVFLPGVGNVFQDIEENERLYVPVGSQAGVGAVTVAPSTAFAGFTPVSACGFAPRPYSQYLQQMGSGYSPQIAYGGQVYGTGESGVGDVGPEGAPDQWNYDECTYTLREGDLINNNPNSLAPYYKTTIHAINALNGGDPAVYAASAGQVVIMPVSACNVARTKAGLPPINQRCDSGYIHDLTSGNCIPPGKPSDPCKPGYMKNPDGSGSCIPDPNYKKPGGDTGDAKGGGGGGKSYTGVILGAVGLLGLLGLGGLMYSKQQEKKKGGGGAKKTGSGHRASHALAARKR